LKLDSDASFLVQCWWTDISCRCFVIKGFSAVENKGVVTRTRLGSV